VPDPEDQEYSRANVRSEGAAEVKRWVFTARIDPGDLGKVVSGRFGSSVMFVHYSRFTGWHWIYPGGEEKIAEPEMLFLDPEWCEAHPAKVFRPLSEKKVAIRRKKEDQLLLF
jgi:hypothetical protein